MQEILAVGSKNSADLYLQAISTLLILRFSQLQPLQCPRFIGRIGLLVELVGSVF
jgi:hypothetical protein